jgi:hypothetical protein
MSVSRPDGLTPEQRTAIRRQARAQNRADGLEPFRDPGLLAFVARLLTEHSETLRGGPDARRSA